MKFTAFLTATAIMICASMNAQAQDRFRLGNTGNGSNLAAGQRSNDSASGSSVRAGPAIVVATPSNCDAQAVGWRVNGVNCSASVLASSHNTSVGATDSALPGRGNAQFLCSNGTLYLNGSATCTVN